METRPGTVGGETTIFYVLVETGMAAGQSADNPAGRAIGRADNQIKGIKRIGEKAGRLFPQPACFFMFPGRYSTPTR
ncbi:MAG: hypothetical protein LUE26_05390 [Alistipes sp.]|nr:hypothetical protein [Alistipes sp.]